MNELMLQKNDDVIEALLKWRSISITGLREILQRVESDAALRQRVIRMEAGRVLRSMKVGCLNKIIYPSSELIFKYGLNSFNEDNVRHDAIVSHVGISLMKFSKIKSLKLPHELQTKSSWRHQVIEPDAVLEIEFQDSLITVALEVELWRKDRKRVYDKILDYAKASEYDNVFYFFTDRGAFDSYKKRQMELLSEAEHSYLKEEISEKLIFVLNPLVAQRVISLGDSEIFHDLQKKKLRDLLGEA